MGTETLPRERQSPVGFESRIVPAIGAIEEPIRRLAFPGIRHVSFITHLPYFHIFRNFR
jgi:hypothetical protein